MTDRRALVLDDSTGYRGFVSALMWLAVMVNAEPVEHALERCFAEPSLFDLWTCGFDQDDPVPWLREAVTVQVDGFRRLDDGVAPIDRIPVDICIGRCHVVRVWIDTRVEAEPAAAHFGVERFRLVHPQDRSRAATFRLLRDR